MTTAGVTRRAALPWALIESRLRELRNGDATVYVGWNRHYRCAPALHIYATAAYPGFRPRRRDPQRRRAGLAAARHGGTGLMRRKVPLLVLPHAAARGARRPRLRRARRRPRRSLPASRRRGPVGGAPTDIAIAQGRAWVPSAGTGELTAIDDRDAPAVQATYPSTAGALRLASDGFSVWLAGAAATT